MLNFSGGKKPEWASRQRKKEIRQKEEQDSAEEQERRDSKVESNDSLEIPGRGETSNISGLLSGAAGSEYCVAITESFVKVRGGGGGVKKTNPKHSYHG